MFQALCQALELKKKKKKAKNELGSGTILTETQKNSGLNKTEVYFSFM